MLTELKLELSADAYNDMHQTFKYFRPGPSLAWCFERASRWPLLTTLSLCIKQPVPQHCAFSVLEMVLKKAAADEWKDAGAFEQVEKVTITGLTSIKAGAVWQYFPAGKLSMKEAKFVVW